MGKQELLILLSEGIISGILSAVVILLSFKLSEERNNSAKKKEENKERKKLDNYIINSGILSMTDTINTHINIQIIPEILDAFKSYEDIVGSSSRDKISPELHVNIAKSYSIIKEWEKAIEQFELSMPCMLTNWNVQFLYGVACANSRNNSHYLKAIEAYSNAIVYIPDNAEVNMKARLYVYRGSIYKRIGRLDEAVSDLKFALTNISTDGYERTDALYNLACVYAMQNNVIEFNNVMAQLESAEDDDTIDRIKKRLQVYAPNFRI